MSNKTRKRIWPASLVLAVAMIGVLAAFVVLAAAPQGTSADGGAPHSCAGMTAAEIAIHNALDDQLNGGNGQCLAAGATPTMTTPTTPPVTGDGSPCDDFDTDTMVATSCVTVQLLQRQRHRGAQAGDRVTRSARRRLRPMPLDVVGRWWLHRAVPGGRLRGAR